MAPVWKRYVRFVADDGGVYGGEPVDAQMDVGLAAAEGKEIAVKILKNASALAETNSFTGETKTVKTLLSPVSSSEVGSIRCIGMNYKDHAKEMGGVPPEIPESFIKPATCLQDPTGPIKLPKRHPHAVDAEVEMTVVIGRDCKDAQPGDALSYVLGYTAANDVTCRDVQGRVHQYGYAKGYDAFCPLGPALVAAGEIPDPHVLSVRSTLDGRVLQDSSTDNLIFSVPEIIAHLSIGTTLPKGTVILTGTPEGIGHSYRPPRYLKPGCTLRIEVGGGIGTLANTVVADTD